MTTPLLTYLRSTVQTDQISVSDFMKTALSHPEFGYYSTRQAIGKSGDFITAPEVSQLFGEMLAGLLLHIWQLYNKPDSCLFEAGPGRGTLLADIDRTYSRLAPDLAKSDWYLLEASPALQDQQTATLPQRTVRHISTLSDLPKQPLFGIANEFFDALGVDQAIYKNGAWHHRMIDIATDELSFLIGPKLTLEQLKTFQAPGTAKPDDIIETSPVGLHLMQSLSTHIAYHGGALIICDYGKTDNHGDTLQAVKDHKAIPVLSAPGESDLTHWVDFDALSTVAKNAGARLIGPVPQGQCLRQLGIEARASQLRQPDNPAADRALIAALDRLLSPAQMGQAFKIALLVPQGDGTPPGFLDATAPMRTGEMS